MVKEGSNHPKAGGPEQVADAVMKDPVVKAAIKHGAEANPSPGQAAASALAATRLSDETSLRSEGQRTVSMIWETTQKKIALMTVGGAVFLAAAVVLAGQWLELANDVRIAAFMFISGAANLVIGFYYGRTNHQRVGGPGGDSAGTR